MPKLFFKNFIFIAIILIAVIFMVNAAAFADDTGTPTKYEVSLHTFKLYNGTEYITLYDGTSATLDIASMAGTNQFVGDFMSGLSVPDGTYTKANIQPSSTFTINGQVTSGARTNGALSGGNCATSTSGDPADCTLTVASSYVPETEYIFSTPIVVKDGVANHKVRVYFDVAGSIIYEGGIIHPQQPTCTVSIE